MPKTTNDDLARMIKQGFDGIDRRFEAVDLRFDRIEGRLDRVEGRLDHVEVRLERIENTIVTDHAHRIERLEDALAMPKPARS